MVAPKISGLVRPCHANAPSLPAAHYISSMPTVRIPELSDIQSSNYTALKTACGIVQDVIENRRMKIEQ